MTTALLSFPQILTGYRQRSNHSQDKQIDCVSSGNMALAC